MKLHSTHLKHPFTRTYHPHIPHTTRTQRHDAVLVPLTAGQVRDSLTVRSMCHDQQVIHAFVRVFATITERLEKRNESKCTRLRVRGYCTKRLRMRESVEDLDWE